MKYVVTLASLAAALLVGALFLWFASGWLTLPLGEEGA
jgi:HAMP domain-containing protein